MLYFKNLSCIWNASYAKVSNNNKHLLGLYISYGLIILLPQFLAEKSEVIERLSNLLKLP